MQLFLVMYTFFALCLNYQTKLHLDFNISYQYYGSTCIPNKAQSAYRVSVNSHSVWDNCSTGHCNKRPFHTAVWNGHPVNYKYIHSYEYCMTGHKTHKCSSHEVCIKASHTAVSALLLTTLESATSL